MPRERLTSEIAGPRPPPVVPRPAIILCAAGFAVAVSMAPLAAESGSRTFTTGHWLSGKRVTVALEECLDRTCSRSSPLAVRQAAELEIALWHSARKQGLLALAGRYRRPNRIDFGHAAFDRIVFSPTRPARLLYNVDRLTAWPLSPPFVARGAHGELRLRVPRRETTQLVVLRGLPVEAASKVLLRPRWLGIGWSLFGLLDRRGTAVRWRSRNYLAFAGVALGREYQIELPPEFVFDAESRAQATAIWHDPYEPQERRVRRR